MNQQERNITLSQVLSPEFINSLDLTAFSDVSIREVRETKEQLQNEINNLITDINKAQPCCVFIDL